jgi:hypothetical protein
LKAAVLRVDIERSLLQPLRIAADEDDFGAFPAGKPRGFEADAGATANQNHGLPEQLRLVLDGDGSGRRLLLTPT